MSVLLALAGAGGPTSLSAVAGTVTIAGGTATLRIDAPATAGTITVAGGVATLRTSQPATAGTVTIAGGAATLAVAVNATAGTVTVAGGTATIRVTIPALAGLVEIQGGTATVQSGGVVTQLSATAGTIDIAGGTATLSATGNVQLAAEAGTITIAGGTAALEGGEQQGGGVQVFGQVVPLRTIFPERRELTGRATIRVHAEATLGVRRASRARTTHPVATRAIAGRVRHGAGCSVHAGPRVAARIGKRSEALTAPLFVRDTTRAAISGRRGTRARITCTTATSSGLHTRAGVTGRTHLPMGAKSDGRLLTRASASGRPVPGDPAGPRTA